MSELLIGKSHTLIERLRIKTHTRPMNEWFAMCKQAADALEQAQSDVLHWKGMTKGRESEIDKHLARIKQLEESLDEAKYDEPELRSKLDKQRQRIEQLEAAGNRSLNWLASYPGGNAENVYNEMRKALQSAGDTDA